MYVQDNDNQGCKCPDGFEGTGTNTSGCVGTLIRTIGTGTQDYQAYANVNWLIMSSMKRVLS